MTDMDPNETLRQLREALDAADAAHQRGVAADEADEQNTVAREFEIEADHQQEACEFAAALDEWLSNGGFLPDAWKRGQ